MDLIKKNMDEGKSQCRPQGSESFETKEGVQFTYRCPEKKVQRQLKGVDFAEEQYGGLEACTLGGDPCSEEGFCCALWKKELYGTTGYDLTTIANDAYTNANGSMKEVYRSMFKANYLTFMSSQGHSFCRDSSKESYTTPAKPTGVTVYYMCDDTPKGKTPLEVQKEKKAAEAKNEKAGEEEKPKEEEVSGDEKAKETDAKKADPKKKTTDTKLKGDKKTQEKNAEEPSKDDTDAAADGLKNLEEDAKKAGEEIGDALTAIAECEKKEADEKAKCIKAAKWKGKDCTKEEDEAKKKECEEAQSSAKYMIASVASLVSLAIALL